MSSSGIPFDAGRETDNSGMQNSNVNDPEINDLEINGLEMDNTTTNESGEPMPPQIPQQHTIDWSWTKQQSFPYPTSGSGAHLTLPSRSLTAPIPRDQSLNPSSPEFYKSGSTVKNPISRAIDNQKPAPPATQSDFMTWLLSQNVSDAYTMVQTKPSPQFVRLCQIIRQLPVPAHTTHILVLPRNARFKVPWAEERIERDQASINEAIRTGVWGNPWAPLNLPGNASIRLSKEVIATNPWSNDPWKAVPEIVNLDDLLRSDGTGMVLHELLSARCSRVAREEEAAAAAADTSSEEDSEDDEEEDAATFWG